MEIKKCPRCNGKKINWRLDGARWCKKCGQRITAAGEMIPSFDRRVFGEDKDDKKIKIETKEDDDNDIVRGVEKQDAQQSSQEDDDW